MNTYPTQTTLGAAPATTPYRIIRVATVLAHPCATCDTIAVFRGLTPSMYPELYGVMVHITGHGTTRAFPDYDLVQEAQRDYGDWMPVEALQALTRAAMSEHFQQGHISGLIYDCSCCRHETTVLLPRPIPYGLEMSR